MEIDSQAANNSIQESLERGRLKSGDEEFDDDGRVKRTGTLITASSHIITAVVGSGVLSLAWVYAQLGWIAGPVVLLIFSFITWFCSNLLVDCYRSPVTGQRNYTYMDVVRANLGGLYVHLCGLAQYGNLVGASIGYMLTTGLSLAAIRRSNCFHKNGHNATCDESPAFYIIAFAILQIILSMVPNFHKISWLSVVATVMSFGYSSIALILAIIKIAEGSKVTTTLTGITDVPLSEKVWKTFHALGNVAFAFSFSIVLIEIEDTLKSSPPEIKVMKNASLVGVSTTTIFYMLCGLCGYAALGSDAPGNFLTGFGFYEPFWLVDLGNLFVAIQMIGGYQVFCQPVYQFVENWALSKWPDNGFIKTEYRITVPLVGIYPLNFFKATWRIIFVVATAVVALIFPFFNDVLGLIGALAFWPLTVYFPTEIYISKAKIPRFSKLWTWLKIMSLVCLMVSLLAACGSIQGLVQSLKNSDMTKKS